MLLESQAIEDRLLAASSHIDLSMESDMQYLQIKVHAVFTDKSIGHRVKINILLMSN